MTKKIVSILSLLLMVSAGYSQSDPSTEANYQLTGKIINQLDIPPPCGMYPLATVIELVIIKYADQGYTKATIGVIVDCPEQYGKDFFAVGKTYSANISTKKPKENNYRIYNEVALEKYKHGIQLWATKLSAVSPPAETNYQLTGKIINQLDIPPPCGMYPLATVIELVIIKYADQGYTKATIGVIIDCPEQYGKDFFAVGKTYSANISTKKPKENNYRIYNEAALEKYQLDQRLWAAKLVLSHQ